MDGIGFDLIPNDAVGLFSVNPDNPLQYLENVTDPYYRFTIIEKTDNRIVVRQQPILHYAPTNYLGAICSSDGSVVYWTNNLSV